MSKQNQEAVDTTVEVSQWQFDTINMLLPVISYGDSLIKDDLPDLTIGMDVTDLINLAIEKFTMESEIITTCDLRSGCGLPDSIRHKQKFKKVKLSQEAYILLQQYVSKFNSESTLIVDTNNGKVGNFKTTMGEAIFAITMQYIYVTRNNYFDDRGFIYVQADSFFQHNDMIPLSVTGYVLSSDDGRFRSVGNRDITIEVFSDYWKISELSIFGGSHSEVR